MRNPRPLFSAALAGALAACAPNAEPAEDMGMAQNAPAETMPASAPAAPVTVARDTTCTPLETRDPNTPDFKPAFPGQTRACGIRNSVPYDVTVVAKGLDRAWAVEPLSDGSLLITEKPGQMHIVSPSGQIGPPIAGVPAVDARGQGGLLDVALSPNFATDRTLFWSFTEPREGGNGTSVARGVLSPDRTRLNDVRVILRTKPTYNNNMHYGSRLAFGPDGYLYVTMGERSARETRMQAQQLDSHLGKTLRIQTDGTPAPGNPFIGRAGALPEIWSYGHRNVQAAAFDPQGRLWTIEHGPRGGDEVNLTEKGENYGWPIATYGIEYSGERIAGAATQRPGTEQPVYYWDPIIAPSGAQFYTGSAFPEWRNSLFVGGLREQRLVRLELDANNRVAGEEHLLVGRERRIRDVRQGPDGALYVVTDGEDGELWKITPRG